MEEIMNLGGDEPDLQLLSNSFPAGTPRVEKRDGHYLLILESEESRDDEAVIADGANVLNTMIGIMLTDGPSFDRPRIKGMTKQNADGSLRHYVNVSVTMKARASMSAEFRLIGPDGKEIEKEKEKGPTDEQQVFQLARDNEPFRRALVNYAQEHTFPNLYKVLEAMEDGNGGEHGLIAKDFVSGKDIKNFKQTAQKDRHGALRNVVQEPKMTLQEAHEMFRKLFKCWIEDLRKGTIREGQEQRGNC
jgi:hypothetical protein